MWKLLRKILNPKMVDWLERRTDGYIEPDDDENIWRLERMGIEDHDYHKKYWTWKDDD